MFTKASNGLREIRCQACGRLQFKIQGEVQYLQRKCRCKALVEVMGHCVVVASPSHCVTMR